MFAVGRGANQFSPMLIVYRRSLGLSAGEVAGLFAIYAATLIPGLLAGGPLSDQLGRRACVLPFAVLAAAAAAVTGLMLVRAARARAAPPSRSGRTGAACSRTAPDPPPAGPAWQGRDYRDAEPSQGERT